MGSITYPPSQDTTLTTSLAAATKAYKARNPLSHTHHASTSAHLPGGNTRTVLHTPPFPLTFSTAAGATLTTLDGFQLTDFLNEYTAGIYGHSHPTIRAALSEALARGWNYGGHCGLEGVLAAEICERWGMDLVRFVNSGTEANMLALAVAGAWSVLMQEKRGRLGQRLRQRRRVLVFNKGYHGSTISSRLNSTTSSNCSGSSGATTAKISLNLPWEFVVGTYNDIEGTRVLIAGLPSTTTTNVEGGDQDFEDDKDLAAIIVEPVLGSGGCFGATPEFLSELRRLADQTGALLVFDEVMTSRLTPTPTPASASASKSTSTTGTTGESPAKGNHEVSPTPARWGVRPDLTTLGKWIGGGMSFGAFGGRQEIMALFDPATGRLEHPGTFNNNVFTMSAGVAGLKSVVTPDVLAGLNARGEELRGKLDLVLCAKGLGSVYAGEGEFRAPLTDAQQEDPEVYARYPPLFVKGVGSMLALHFTGPRRAEWHQLLWLWMVERGFWIAARGFMSLSIELKPLHYDGLVAAFEGFVKTYHRDLLDGYGVK
jgi:glutamate-1-semialdehyde 2,1-aminomutase